MAAEFLPVTFTHLPFYSFTLLLFYSFMQNKPNLLNAQMNVSSILINHYENIHLLGRRKNKPKTNPIKPNFKPTAGGRYLSVGTDLTDIVYIDAGFEHSTAIDKDGNIWVWGRNQKGQLGLGHTNSPRNYAEKMTMP